MHSFPWSKIGLVRRGPTIGQAQILFSGPFYAIFALGACASVPTTIPFWLAVGICAASAAFSGVVGVSGWVRNRIWSSAPAPEAMTADSARAVRVHAVRYLIAVGIAGALGVLGGAGHANWTMAGAAVPLAATNRKSRILRGIHRVIGTLAGILRSPIVPLDLAFCPAEAWRRGLLTCRFPRRFHGRRIG